MSTVREPDETEIQAARRLISEHCEVPPEGWRGWPLSAYRTKHVAEEVGLLHYVPESAVLVACQQLGIKRVASGRHAGRLWLRMRTHTDCTCPDRWTFYHREGCQYRNRGR